MRTAWWAQPGGHSLVCSSLATDSLCAPAAASGDVPEALKGRTLMALDMGSLIAGAKYRGEFEDRLKSIIKEVRQGGVRVGRGGMKLLGCDWGRWAEAETAGGV
jgi:hypothetical protein